MSLLTLSVGRAGVVAVVGGTPPVPVRLPAGPDGWEATALWHAVLEAVGTAVRRSGVTPDALALTATAPTTAVWDAESLGAARPIVPLAYGPALAALRESEPHTWALLVSGRCAVGDLPGYLVARMTRGVWQVAATAVSEDLPAAAGDLPAAAEPWPGPGLVCTDPGAFAGLALPLDVLAGVPER